MLLFRVPGEMCDTCEIWGSVSGITEDPSSLGYDTVSTGGNVSKDRCTFVFRVIAVQEDWTVLLRIVKALRFPETSVSICGCARRNIRDDVNLHLKVGCMPVSKTLSSEKSDTWNTQSFRPTHIDVITAFIQRRYSSCQHSIVIFWFSKFVTSFDSLRDCPLCEAHWYSHCFRCP
jgi:hypothetical protein